MSVARVRTVTAPDGRSEGGSYSAGMTPPKTASRPTQAVVLAGGQGSRLRPYTDDRPKPMVEIPGTGTPIIGHQLAWLAEEG